ncbi:DMT family transporter [Sphingosinicella sp. LHD-64]|uniref:DMT family transporter n=1 Tax=Sphingosinicella sp. LHD-64 TaxID=3072139 RepID=UPI002810685C|nr:DMT family transporter [Sphingosinicella sp. LHD-64]MDQ8756708.1 DMT family transporter [Sphingosinicella sp. LHD-64]
MPAPPPASVAIPFAVATLGIALFSTMDAVMKHLVLAIGTYNALLWRTMAGAVLGGAVFFALGKGWPARAVLRLHLIRGVLSAVMALLFFWGLARVPLAQGVALAFVAPLIALYLAAVILKEKIARRAVFASLFGFAGVLVILAGQAEAELGPEALHGALAILASAALYAYNIILMRQQAQVAEPMEVAFFMSAIMTSCFLLASPVLAEMPPVAELPAVMGAAALAFFSLMCLSWAYARAEAQYLAPVEYTAFVWASLFGFLVFAEPVQPLTLLGAAMIVAACLAAARRGGGAQAPAVEIGQ